MAYYRKTENSLSLLGGAVLGAVAMYLLDPEAGRRRREQLAELGGQAAREGGEYLGSAWERASEAARRAGHAISETAGDVRHSSSSAVSAGTGGVAGLGHSIAE